MGRKGPQPLKKLAFQQRSYSCGAAATLACLRAMGIKATEREVRRHAATDPQEGTSEYGIKNALLRYNRPFSEIKTNNFPSAATQLRGHLAMPGGGAAILSTEFGEHWEAAIGLLGEERVVIFDPQRTQLNLKASGLYVLSGRQLKHYWSLLDGHWYAILVK